MDPTLGQAVNNTTLAEHQALDRIVVCQHGDDGTIPAGVGDTGDDPCALRNQRFGLRSRPVINGHFVTGLQQARSHAAAHVPQSDKSDFHDECSCTVAYCFPR